MKNLKLSTILALTLGLGTVAEAANVLYTPVLLTDQNVTYARCLLTNISDEEITVRIALLNLSGDVILDTGDFVIGPGATNANAINTNIATVCRFTVPSKKKVRAEGCISRMALFTCDTQFDAY